MPKEEFEIVIGAMDCDSELIECCASFLGELNLTTVVSPRPFEIPAARNLAMRAASGEVCLQMDADTFLDVFALERLYGDCFASGQQCCVVGQVVGYGNNNDEDVTAIAERPFEEHMARLAKLMSPADRPSDPRFGAELRIPWAFVWTGFAALPMTAVRQHDLYFDESFRGWGVDDLEWGYRIWQAGLPIQLRDGLYGLHLPHLRSVADNKAAERLNFRRFLAKWPTPDVELVAAFNDIEANRLHASFRSEMEQLPGRGPAGLASARARGGSRDVLLLAGPADEGGLGAEALRRLDWAAEIELIPLVGLALPLEDGAAEECWIMPSAQALSTPFRDKLAAEASRVSRRPPTWLE
jgi:hypothetical protein